MRLCTVTSRGRTCWTTFEYKHIQRLRPCEVSKSSYVWRNKYHIFPKHCGDIYTVFGCWKIPTLICLKRTVYGDSRAWNCSYFSQIAYHHYVYSMKESIIRGFWFSSLNQGFLCKMSDSPSILTPLLMFPLHNLYHSLHPHVSIDVFFSISSRHHRYLTTCITRNRASTHILFK